MKCLIERQKFLVSLLVSGCYFVLFLSVPSGYAQPSLQSVQTDIPLAFGAEQVVVSTDDVDDAGESVFAADLDSDGDIDILGAFRDSNRIVWYENIGGINPIFKLHVISNNAIGAQAVYAADLDGDKDIDVLSASDVDDKIAWYENDGSAPPVFSEHRISRDETDAKDVIAIDLDLDGDMDVLSVSRLYRVAWFENNGNSTPSFSAHTISTSIIGYSIFAADIDGDGDIDVLSGDARDGGVAWYENDGGESPTFTEHIITLQFSPRSLFAADLDDDEDNDILATFVTSENEDFILWFENSGETPPVFSEKVISNKVSAPFNILAIDLDKDGDNDVISATFLENKVFWFENDSSTEPQFTSHTLAMNIETANSVYAADVNDDSYIDVLSSSFNDDFVAWHENDGASPPIFTTHIMPKGADGPNQVYAADINSDGNIDILSASDNDNQIAWYQNSGGNPPDFIQQVVTTSANGAFSVFAEDMDGDEDLDMLSASFSSGRVDWYENQGGESPQFTRHMIVKGFEGVRSVHAADLNNDGYMDAISAAVFVDTVAIHLNDGGQPPTFLSLYFSTRIGGAKSVHGADIDGDGDNDILAGGFFNSDLFWFENTTSSEQSGTTPTFTLRYITRDAPGTSFIHTDDLDRDGDLDVLTAGGNSIIWYENNGSPEPSFTKRTITVNTKFAQSVYSLDLDGDGDIDVMSASFDDNKIAVFENIGGNPPQFEEHVLNDKAFQATTVIAADLDNDGDPDVIGGSWLDDTISWNENQTAFDLNKLIRYLLGDVTELSETEEMRLDANNDGLINIADVISFLSR